MVKEVSLLKVDEKQTKKFEEVYKELTPIIRRAPGLLHDELLHVVENPGEYFLIIQWESLDAHKKFTESEDFPLLVEKWGVMQKEAIVRHCVVVESAD